MRVTVHEAKTHLSRLLAAVERGEEVVIARRDKPVARLVKEKPQNPRRRLGCLLEPGQKPPDFAALFDKKLEDEIARDFYPDLSDDEWEALGKNG